MSVPEFSLRPAKTSDIPTLERLIAESARALGRGYYNAEQIEAALGTAWGVDSELISDGTYFLIEIEETAAACGGWSWRRTLFGADRQPGRESRPLDPSRDAARIRAFFVHPVFARRGLGRALLSHCEAEALSRGFRTAQLMATLPGRELYAACGYIADTPVEHSLNEGLSICFVPMKRELR